MIKAAFFDIDGTLISFKTHQIPASTIDAIHQLQQQGVKIFLATGRHPIWVQDLGFDFDGFVALNGGLCTTRSGEVLYKKALPAEDFKSMLKYQREKESFPCACVLDNSIWANYVNDTAIALYNHVGVKLPDIQPIENFADQPVYQLIAFFNAEQEKEIMANMPGCVATRWHPDFADVVPKGIDKALSLAALAEKTGVRREEIMAVGDGFNDLTMVRYAGLGVAMGNAQPIVKENAAFITLSNGEDGVAYAVKKFVLV